MSKKESGGKEKKGMNKGLKALLWVIGIIVVLAVVVELWLGSLVKWSVNNVAPKLLGVPTSVETVRLAPLRGKVFLENLHVGNPEGFHTDGIFDLAKMVVDLDMKSLLSDSIVIKEITIGGMEVTYEQGLLHSNVGTLLDNLSGDQEKEAEEEVEEKPEEEAAEGGKKVVIKKFSLADSKVRVAATGMMGLGLPIPLPSMELEDIGAKTGGATVKDVIIELLKDVGGLVTGAITGVGGAVVDGAAAVGGVVADGATAVGGAVADGTKALAGAVTGLFGDDDAAEEKAEEATDAAAEKKAEEPAADSAKTSIEEGAEAVNSAIADGAAAVSGAVTDGAKALSGAIGGLFGGGDAAEEKAEEATDAAAEEKAEESAAEAEKTSIEEGAEAVNSALADGAAAVSGAVTDGAKALSGAIGGLFGGKAAEEAADVAAE
ncbi:MAG: hypothetical protein ILO10_06775 [Kiritimatiellae bacterium]|nr:hypothetical protein [Kiritimatiellia bacterium]